MSDPTHIYKIAHTDDWKSAVSGGTNFRGSAIDQTGDYFHFSTATQIPVTLANYYSGKAAQGALTLVEYDAAALERDYLQPLNGFVRYDGPNSTTPLAYSAGGYPHVYGVMAQGLPTRSGIVSRTGLIEETSPGVFRTFLSA